MNRYRSLIALGRSSIPTRLLYTSCSRPNIYKFQSPLLRTLSTYQSNEKDVPTNDTLKDIESTPPFPVRVAIVCSSVGLCTPLFATLGVGRLWYSYLPKTSNGQVAKYSVGLLIGGGGATLIYQHLLPFLSNHSEVVLPFALSNAVMAGVWYSAAEMYFGFKLLKAAAPPPILSDKIEDDIAASVNASVTTKSTTTATEVVGQKTQEQLRPILDILKVGSKVPLIGAGIGALTALTSPLLWPFVFQICFPDSAVRYLLRLDDPVWLLELYSWIAVPVGVPIGLLSGLALHTVLYPAVVGVEGSSWTVYALPVLVLLIAIAVLYFSLCRSSLDDYFFEERRVLSDDKRSLLVVSANMRTGSVVFDDGALASKAAWIHTFVRVLTILRNPYNYMFPPQTSTNTKNGGKYEGQWLRLLSSENSNTHLPYATVVSSVGPLAAEQTVPLRYTMSRLSTHDVSTHENRTPVQTREKALRVSAAAMRARRDLFLLLDTLLPYAYLRNEEARLLKQLEIVEEPIARAGIFYLVRDSLPVRTIQSLWPVASVDLVLRYVSPSWMPQRVEWMNENVLIAVAGFGALFDLCTFLLKDEKAEKEHTRKLKLLVNQHKELSRKINSIQRNRAHLSQVACTVLGVKDFDLDKYVDCVEETLQLYSQGTSNQTGSLYSRPRPNLEQWLTENASRYSGSMIGELTDVSAQLLASTGMLLANLDFAKNEFDRTK